MTPEEFIPKYEAALASQDWQQVAPLIHQDAIVTFSDGSIHDGINAIQKAFEKNFKLIKSEKYQVLNVKWTEKSTQKASYSFEFQWSGYIDGELYSGEGKGDCELIKVADDWLMVKEVLRK